MNTLHDRHKQKELSGAPRTAAGKDAKRCEVFLVVPGAERCIRRMQCGAHGNTKYTSQEA